MSAHYCNNCGKGARDLPPRKLLGGTYHHPSEPNQCFDDTHIKWIKVNKYLWACSCKCAHELEEFITGGGVEGTTSLDENGAPKIDWKPCRKHL